MNRIVLIGNGFDLAHGLPTRYEDFINWYWDQRVRGFSGNTYSVSRDQLCEFRIDDSYSWNTFYYNYVGPQPLLNRMGGRDIIHNILQSNYGIRTKHSFSRFFDNIITSIETKGWVDIENEYYNLLISSTIDKTPYMNLNDLNGQFHFLTYQLIKYLKTINSTEVKRLKGIWDSIYSPIKPDEISIEGRHFVEECVNSWIAADEQVACDKIERYGYNDLNYLEGIRLYKESISTKRIYYNGYPDICMLPDMIMLLNFNYTDTSNFYMNRELCVTTHIHGELQNPQSIIFGYGDELDEKFHELQNLNNNECLRNIKSIRYLESSNYHDVLAFMESAPFQVLIMGHSCGNSDRTLLNTLFEHKNCISIKPYYHQKEDDTDNYLDIIQNISRNFTDMKRMRDRVVNKTLCEPLAQAKKTTNTTETI